MTMWFDSRKLIIKFLYASSPLVFIVAKMSFIKSGLVRFLLHVGILQSSWLKIPVWIKYGQRATMSIKQGTISMRLSMRLRWICSNISGIMCYVWNFIFILFYMYIFYFIYNIHISIKRNLFFIFLLFIERIKFIYLYFNCICVYTGCLKSPGRLDISSGKIFFEKVKVIPEVKFNEEFNGDLHFDLEVDLHGFLKVNFFF